MTDQLGRQYRSRIEDVGDGVLVLARPLDLPVEHEFGIGAPVLVSWPDQAGVVEVDTELLDSQLPGRLGLLAGPRARPVPGPAAPAVRPGAGAGVWPGSACWRPSPACRRAGPTARLMHAQRGGAALRTADRAGRRDRPGRPGVVEFAMAGERVPAPRQRAEAGTGASRGRRAGAGAAVRGGRERGSRACAGWCSPSSCGNATRRGHGLTWPGERAADHPLGRADRGPTGSDYAARFSRAGRHRAGRARRGAVLRRPAATAGHRAGRRLRHRPGRDQAGRAGLSLHRHRPGRLDARRGPPSRAGAGMAARRPRRACQRSGSSTWWWRPAT